MNFLGFDFFCDYTDTSSVGISPMGASNQKYNYVEVNNALIDELYVTKNTEVSDTELVSKWDYDTIINAKYDGNYRGGNIDFTVRETDLIRLKVREVDSFTWKTLAEFPVNSLDDLKISYVDRYQNNGKKLEYAIVPITANTEGNYSTAQVESDFEGISVTEANRTYRAFVYDNISVTRNNNVNYVTTLGNKYPFSVTNSSLNYSNGTISAGFYPIVDNEIDLSDFAKVIKYRENLLNFLTDGKPKVLKIDDGRSWIVGIDSNISVYGQERGYYVEFGFTQLGNSQITEDLYNNGLLFASNGEVTTGNSSEDFIPSNQSIDAATFAGYTIDKFVMYM